MDQLGALLGILCALAGLYALGRVHGRGDRLDAWTDGHRSGQQAGWLSAFRANLWAQRHAAVSHNAARSLYTSRAAFARQPDDTFEFAKLD